MLLRQSLLAVALLILPSLAWAGASNVPCGTPFVFSGAAVNVVVLPYSLPASFRRSTQAGEELGALVQLETILAIAKFGSIGVVQLVGNTQRECTPEIVLDKLIGKLAGAREKMKPGSGLVLIWGRVFESGPHLFLQSYFRFLRMGVDESIEVRAGEHTLKGSLSTQAFACAPRKIAIRDITDIQRQFASTRLLHSQPNATSSAVQLQEGPFSYWITDVQRDWVQIQQIDRTADLPQTVRTGWMQARATDAEWSLRRQMPELYFVEGVTGYLMARVQSSAPAVVDRALQGADAAIARYLEAWGVNAVLGSDAAAGGTPLAVAVPRQLQGFVALLRGRGSDASLTDARTQFERAAALASHSSNARNLVTMTQVAQTYRQPSADQPPRQFIDDLRGLLGSDPDNAMILANLTAVYELVLSPAPTAPPSWALQAADREQLVKQRDGLKTLTAR